jgi:hypothetical protein
MKIKLGHIVAISFLSIIGFLLIKEIEFAFFFLIFYVMCLGVLKFFDKNDFLLNKVIINIK